VQGSAREHLKRRDQRLGARAATPAVEVGAVDHRFESPTGGHDRPGPTGNGAPAATGDGTPTSVAASTRSRLFQLQRTVGNAVVARNLQRAQAQPTPLRPTTQAALQHPVPDPGTNRLPIGGFKETGATVPAIQRLGMEDVVPDFILNPIKTLVGKGESFVSGLTPKADSAATGAEAEAGTAAAKAEGETSSKVTIAKAKGAGATAEATAKGATAAATARAAKATGGTKVAELKKSVAVADHGTDPVKSKLQPPPGGKIAGAGTGASAKAADAGDWNCDEAAIAAQVGGVKKTVLDGVTKMVKSVVPENVLRFAENGIAKVKSIADSVKKGVTAAKQAVTQWIDEKTKPVRELVNNAQKAVGEKIEEAKKAISDKAAEVKDWAATKWTALKDKVTSKVKGAIEWAKNGVSSLVDKARNLAGRFWNALPKWVQAGLTGAAAALAAPVVLAYKAIEKTTGFIEEKANWLKGKVVQAADAGVSWLGEKYTSARESVVNAGKRIAEGAKWVKDTAVDVGKAVYKKVDDLSGGRLTKWKNAAKEKLAELKGEVCAVTGAAAGPCVERFVPEPVGENSSFGSFNTKADITVPVEGVPCKLAAGASVKIERSAKTYKATLTGEVFGGVGVKFGEKGGGGGAGGGGGGGASGELSVEGTLAEKSKNKVAGMLAIGGSGAAGLPPAPIKFGGGQPAAPAQPGSSVPTGQSGGSGVAGGGAGGGGGGGIPGGAGGGGAEVEGEFGKKATMSFTYTFDATKDKTSCDGLGGLTALLASQGAAGLLPAPFSNIAAAGGQMAFADKLTSQELVVADTGSISAKGEAGGAKLSASGKAERGVSVKSEIDEKSKDKLLTAKLFQGVTGEGAASFAPGDVGVGSIGGSLGGKMELSVIYNMTKDSLNGNFKQTLSGSITIGLTSGLESAVNQLPSVIREKARGQLQSVLKSVNMTDLTEASVSFEFSSVVDNLASLGSALDSELNKGSGASATGVWGAVSSFVKNPANVYTEYNAKLNLTEKVLGVKGSFKTPEQLSGSGEASLSRGQEIKLAEGTTKPKE